jgi:4-oxalocrotonate tautomerase
VNGVVGPCVGRAGVLHRYPERRLTGWSRLCALSHAPRRPGGSHEPRGCRGLFASGGARWITPPQMEEILMPIITVTITPQEVECKRCLAEALTKTAAEITKIPAEKFIVIVDENARESIAVGGKLLSDQ